ncbi:MAG: hypothetical protein MJE77_03710 [Proteobacteria bacterium]|nr:hypothetical protein [Pseudomonadota bacterium]
MRIAVAAAALLALLANSGEARGEFQPRVAIVMCQDTYAEGWFDAHSSSQGMVGLAGLVGVPYRTLTLGELLSEPSPSYTSIWFSWCQFIAEEHIPSLIALLQTHLSSGGSLFLDGPLGTAYRDSSNVEQYRDMKEAFPFLNLVDKYWGDVVERPIYTTDSTHPIAVRVGHAGGTQLTQGIPDTSDGFGFINGRVTGSEVLLEIAAPTDDASDVGPRALGYPFLVVTEPGDGAKIAAIGSYGNYLGPGAPFRNEAPAGFYQNGLMPYLVETLLWLVGPDDSAFASVQLSHAPMTVIGRVDGDWSHTPDATVATFDYLADLARHTGVATVYGIVSVYAVEASWNGFIECGGELQELGGSIGSHSHTHNYQMSEELDDAGWNTEVAGSMHLIRDSLFAADYVPDTYAFINPGGAIQSRDYGKFFPAIDLYMTHGGETIVPYSSGVMGFGLPDGVEPVPVINNTAAPDFQWLYLDEWVYTVQQAADIQRMLLDYYQNTVGRGVLYNQMWHDYAISNLDKPLHYPDTPTVLPLFDVNRAHFESNRIYAPSVRELMGKMHLAHKVGITSSENGNSLAVDLDYAAVPDEHRAYVTGMGVRVNGSAQPIAQVTVDDAPHHAFTDNTVILPPADGEKQQLSIQLGTPAQDAIRLTHISKPLDQIEYQGDEFKVWLGSPGLFTQFCIAGPKSVVILDASWYTRMGSSELCGHMVYGSTSPSFRAHMLDTGDHDLYVAGAGRTIDQADWSEGILRLTIAAGGDAAMIDFESARAPDTVLVAGEQVDVELDGSAFSVEVPSSTDQVLVEIRMPAIDGGDGEPPGGCGCIAGRPEPAGHGGLALFLLFLAAFAEWRHSSVFKRAWREWRRP